MLVELFIDKIEEEVEIEIAESLAYGYEVHDLRAILKEVKGWRKKYPKKG